MIKIKLDQKERGRQNQVNWDRKWKFLSKYEFLAHNQLKGKKVQKLKTLKMQQREIRMIHWNYHQEWMMQNLLFDLSI